MDNILDEAAAIVQCKECPWYKGCVLPIRVTPEDVHKQWQSIMPGQDPNSNQYAFNSLLAQMAQMAQNAVLEGCPVFISRLRANEKLATKIKKMMQNWGEEN